jgi:curli biogenesis system outer membrane secretion channel CsgG
VEISVRLSRVSLTLAVAAMAISTVLQAQSAAPVRTVKDGILDEMILYVDKPPRTSSLVIQTFSATDSDIVQGEKKDETKKLQSDAPRLLADAFVAAVKQSGAFTTVAVIDAGAQPPADALVVEGKFTELDPGSRAKRYFVGFGSGKSAVSVEGTIKSADGTVVASFKQRRLGVMGMAGGDSIGKMSSDARNIGEDVAKFVSAWSRDQKLK